MIFQLLLDKQIKHVCKILSKLIDVLNPYSFSKYDNCRLIIKDNPAVYGVNNLLNEIIKMQYKTDCADILYIDEQLTDLEMASIYKNAKILCDVFPEHRWFDNLCVSAYIGVTPPAPYDHIIHQETVSKIWSSVTYITPETNCGTKMYTKEDKDTLVKEAPWKPNTTMIFAGVEGKTWHSYNSTEESNRITLNFFIKNKDVTKQYFYP